MSLDPRFNRQLALWRILDKAFTYVTPVFCAFVAIWLLLTILHKGAP